MITLKIQHGNTPDDTVTITVHDPSNAEQIYEAVLELSDSHPLAARCVVAVELGMFNVVTE